MDSMIKVEHLKYRYPHTKKLVLDDVSFTVNAGEFVGIIGRNGAGKSTLTQAFMGLVPQFYKGAYGGKVFVNGLQADQIPVAEICKSVGLVFQNPFNQLSGAKETVYDEIAFGLQNLGIEREEMKRRVNEALSLLDIEQYRERNPFDLSGGQMQRVAIASILVMQPDILVLDEPTSQLDPAGTEEVFKAIEKLSKAGKTIIIVEQKIEKIASYCDKILLLDDGKLVAYDTPEVIFSRNDLDKLGVQEPVFTRICKALQIQKENHYYPVTLQEAVTLQQKILEHIKEKTDICQNQSKETRREKEINAERKGNHCLDINNEMPIEKPAKGDTVFKIQDLDFSYFPEIPIIQKLNLTLNHQTTAIIGQNGAGKTTLVKLLKGLLKPIKGNIYYQNNDIAEMTVAMLAGEVGYVFQNPDDQIFKNNVLDEVMFGPLNIGMTKEDAKEKSIAALKLVGLEKMQDRNPYDCELSERKMIAIASVVAMDTKVIIFDEPTIAQDYAGKETIKKIIRQLSEQGKLVVAILHDMDFVAECFERVIVMAHGRILTDGCASEIFTQERILQEAKIELPHVAGLCKELGLNNYFLTVEEFV